MTAEGGCAWEGNLKGKLSRDTDRQNWLFIYTLKTWLSFDSMSTRLIFGTAVSVEVRVCTSFPYMQGAEVQLTNKQPGVHYLP